MFYDIFIPLWRHNKDIWVPENYSHLTNGYVMSRIHTSSIFMLYMNSFKKYIKIFLKIFLPKKFQNNGL